VQTSHDKGANSSTAKLCVSLGRVLRGCSRRHTPMAHEEETLQRCRSAAAVAIARSPHKTCSQSYLQSSLFLGGGGPSREDPRRNKRSMRAEASAGLEKYFTRAARRRTEPVSLRHLLSHSGLGKEARDGQHQGRQTIEERGGLYRYTNGKLAGPSAPLIPQIALPMVSSKNAHARATHIFRRQVLWR